MRLTRRGISWGDAPSQPRRGADDRQPDTQGARHAERLEVDREVRSTPVPRYVLKPLSSLSEGTK